MRYNYLVSFAFITMGSFVVSLSTLRIPTRKTTYKIPTLALQNPTSDFYVFRKLLRLRLHNLTPDYGFNSVFRHKKQVDIEYLESWDDGEVAWDFIDEIKETNTPFSYFVYHPEEINMNVLFDTMDDGEVPWGPPQIPTLALQNPSSDFYVFRKNDISPEKKDGNVNSMENQPSMYDKIVSKEDIFSDFIGLDKIDLQQEIVVAMFAVVMIMKAQRTDNQDTSIHKINPLSLCMLVFALVFMKNVHSAS